MIGQKGANMKWKNRLTNYNFWISIVSATLLILQAFNIKMDIANINEIVTALLGLLVVIGIINDPTKSSKDAESKAKTSIKSVQNEEQSVKQIENESNQGLNDLDMPSDQQNANTFGIVENDLQVLIEKISKDLSNKYEDLNKAVDSLNILNQKQQSAEENTSNKIDQKIDCNAKNTETVFEEAKADEISNMEGQNIQEHYDHYSVEELQKNNNINEECPDAFLVEQPTTNIDAESTEEQNQTAIQPEVTHFNIVN